MANKTKQALAESLKRLLTTKPLNKITITDITEDCAISRMTFYYHFRDIYDLIEWICMDEGGRAIGSCKDYDTWEEGFQSVCRSVLKNRSFVEAVYRSIRHDQIEEYLYRVLYEMIFAVVQERTEGEPIPEAERERLTEFFTMSFLGTALLWVRKGFRETPEELTRGLSMIVSGQIDLALRNYKAGVSKT